MNYPATSLAQTGGSGTIPATDLGWSGAAATSSTNSTVSATASASDLSAGKAVATAPVAASAATQVLDYSLASKLTLQAPVTTVPGTYTGTLTITLV